MNKVTIAAIGLDGADGMVVKFSDGTTAGYVVEELLELRPNRERTPGRKPVNKSTLPAEKLALVDA